MRNLRKPILLAAWAALWCSRIGAAGADDPTLVIRQDAILQRMAWQTDSNVVATVGVTHDGSNFNSTVKLWDSSDGRLIRTFDEDKDSQLEIAFSRQFLAIAVNDGTSLVRVRLLDTDSGELRHTIDKKLVADVRVWSGIALSPDGRKIAVAGWLSDIRSFVKLWHIQNDRLIARELSVVDLPPLDERERRVNAVSCLAFSPDGRLFAAGSADSKIRIYSGVSGELTTMLTVGGDPVHYRFGAGGIAFAADGRTLVSGGTNNDVLLWDVAQGKPRMILKGHGATVRAVACDPRGKLLATASPREISGAEIPGAEILGDPHEVLLWDAERGKRLRTIAEVAYPVNVLTFSPDGKTLAVCAGAGNDVGKSVRTAGEIRFVRLE